MAATYTRTPFAIALLLATGCGRDPAPPAPVGPTIEITLDDGAPRRASLGGPQPLVELIGVAPASWLEVIASSDDERTLELTRPATTYPDADVRFYFDQDRPALGVFRRITPDMPPDVARIARQPIVGLAGITTVEIRTRPRVMPPLAVTVDGSTQPIAESLRSLKLHPTNKPRERGWSFGDVIALAVPRDRGVRAIRLHTRAGSVTPLDVQAARSEGAILKRNQRGQYVFRMWDNSGKAALEVRDVTSIDIE